MKRLFLIVLVLWSTQLHAQSYDEGLSQATGKLAASIAGREGQIATVLDLNGLDGATTQLGKLVAQDVFDQLVGSAGNVTWIDPAQRDFVVQENQLAADRLMDPATQKQLGKLLGLSLIVSGTVTELGDSARIQLRATEIETARVIGVASTTVALPESLKRLNDRRTGSTPYSARPTRPEARNEMLVLRANTISLLRYASSYPREPETHFKWSATLEIENISGQEIHVRFVEMGFGACTFNGGRVGEVSGLSAWGWERYYGEKKSREERIGLATRLAPGQVTVFTVTDRCERNNLPSFATGTVDLSVGFAVDSSEDYSRLAMSVTGAEITTNAAD